MVSSRSSKLGFVFVVTNKSTGVNFFETYAPVVQWTTIQLMLILEVLLGLKSKQDDITASFVPADVQEGENIYVEMP